MRQVAHNPANQIKEDEYLRTEKGFDIVTERVKEIEVPDQVERTSMKEHCGDNAVGMDELKKLVGNQSELKNGRVWDEILSRPDNQIHGHQCERRPGNTAHRI